MENYNNNNNNFEQKFSDNFQQAVEKNLRLLGRIISHSDCSTLVTIESDKIIIAFQNASKWQFSNLINFVDLIKAFFTIVMNDRGCDREHLSTLKNLIANVVISKSTEGQFAKNPLLRVLMIYDLEEFINETTTFQLFPAWEKIIRLICDNNFEIVNLLYDFNNLSSGTQEFQNSFFLGNEESKDARKLEKENKIIENLKESRTYKEFKDLLNIKESFYNFQDCISCNASKQLKTYPLCYKCTLCSDYQKNSFYLESFKQKDGYIWNENKEKQQIEIIEKEVIKKNSSFINKITKNSRDNWNKILYLRYHSIVESFLENSQNSKIFEIEGKENLISILNEFENWLSEQKIDSKENFLNLKTKKSIKGLKNKTSAININIFKKNEKSADFNFLFDISKNGEKFHDNIEIFKNLKLLKESHNLKSEKQIKQSERIIFRLLSEPLNEDFLEYKKHLSSSELERINGQLFLNEKRFEDFKILQFYINNFFKQIAKILKFQELTFNLRTNSKSSVLWRDAFNTFIDKNDEFQTCCPSDQGTSSCFYSVDDFNLMIKTSGWKTFCSSFTVFHEDNNYNILSLKESKYNIFRKTRLFHLNLMKELHIQNEAFLSDQLFNEFKDCLYSLTYSTIENFANIQKFRPGIDW